MQIVKNVKLVEDLYLGENIKTMPDFIQLCKSDFKKSIEPFGINIENSKELAPIHIDPDLIIGSDKLSFQISKEDVAKITTQILNITRDPLHIAHLLKNLETEMGDLLTKNEMNFGEEDLPEYLIAGNGSFIPGPPPKEYVPRKKYELLDKLLLQHELDEKLNIEGYAPKFIGFVDKAKADAIVATGHTFTEDKQVSRVLLHGSYAHRLMIRALIQAVKNNELDLTLSDGSKLSIKQLLELLVLTIYPVGEDKSKISLWAITIDSVEDTQTVEDKLKLDPTNYNFSCRSPFVFTSLILCFGKELGLPNLQHYMLDSHWKAAYAMVHRVKEEMSSEDIKELMNIDSLDARIYDYCMEVFSTLSGGPGKVGQELPFAYDKDRAILNPNYEAIFPDYLDIVRKVKLKPMGDYGSWEDFFHSLPSKKTAFSFMNFFSKIFTTHEQEKNTYFKNTKYNHLLMKKAA